MDASESVEREEGADRPQSSTSSCEGKLTDTNEPGPSQYVNNPQYTHCHVVQYTIYTL